MNICGFILAAGAGTRMRPATLLRPKALLPFCGAPLLEITLSALEAALPADAPVIVNACHLGEQVREAVEKLAAPRTRRLHCSMEERLLNHGGGLRKGVAESGVEADTVLVHNADIVTDFDLRRLLEAHETAKADATVLLIDNSRPDGVALDDESAKRGRDASLYTWEELDQTARNALALVYGDLEWERLEWGCRCHLFYQG